MLFNSIEFLIFFPLVTIAYFLLPNKFRWILLLIASYYFYMVWKPIYVVLIVACTLVNYFAAILIEKHTKYKKLFLIISLSVSLGILFLFKYYGFFTEIINSLFGSNFNVLALILPMGISFYTFQTLSYTIDVYKGTKTAERHLGYFALYVIYFPQLVAGPIERSNNLLPQLRQEHKFDKEKTISGLQKMLFGFFKKLVIADNIGAIINPIFSDVAASNGFTLIISILLFGIQIYCDFSAYSDIAIGASRILGIELMENFKRPYFSKSIKEFWSRWHISLSTWFRDYVYIPLGGSKKGLTRTQINIFIVFLLSGLWHGANLTFVVWGLIHAVFHIIESLTLNLRNKFWQKINLNNSKLQKGLRWFATMFVVFFAWIFFRANSINDAFLIINQIFTNFGTVPLFDLWQIELNALIIGISGLVVYSVIEEKYKNIFEIFKNKLVFRWMTYYFFIFTILVLGYFGLTEFIYFQF